MSDFRLIKSGWNAEILAARQAHGGRLRIVCPFIKAGPLSRILQANGSAQAEVITRFDLNCFDQGVSDIAALEAILAAGGRVRGVKGLHAKLYLFGGTSVIATSANVTEAAFRRNHEFGFVSDEPDVVDACEAYFEDLWKQAKPDLTAGQLKDWKKKLKAARRGRQAAAPGATLPDYGATVGQDSPFTTSSAAVTHDNNAFLKFFGTARDREKRTTEIGEMIAEDGANWACTYPASKPPRQVEDGDVIYMGRLVHSENDIVIFGKAIGLAHRDDIDRASKAEIKLRPWKEGWPVYVRVRDGHFLDATLEDGVSMSAMLQALGENAFASTQENARRGSGNTNPFLSYGRKAHMKLTPQARAWIDERLDAKLRRHGEVDLTPAIFQPPA